jgi:3-oxoacyl-[acyl-carrier protein] reductase
MKIDLTGKVVLVTGAAKGIGRAVAIMLASCGAKVAINYMNSREEAERTVLTITESGGIAAAFQADLRNWEEGERIISEIGEKFGKGVDILVNNAGDLIQRCANAEMNDDIYHRVMDANLKTTVIACKLVIPSMIASGGGRIVNISSLAAHNGGGPGASIYAAGKAAVLAYTKGLAKELAPRGITVNSVAPGFIGGTDFHAVFTSDEVRKAIVGSIPLKREGTPQDVAGAVLFLVSDLSSYLTGETIEINGGMNMR